MFRRMLPSFRLTAAFALSSLGASSLGIRASEAPTKSFVHDTLSTAEPIRPPLKATEQPTTKVKLFGGHLNAELAEQIAAYIGVPVSRVETSNFADGESSVKVLDPIEQSDVFIVQSTGPPVNENLIELLLMISTLRRSAAKNITAVIPYFGYKRETAPSGTDLLSSDTTVCLSAADVAKLLETMGVDNIISVDMQPPGYGQIEGFFDNTIRVDNLRPYSLAIKYVTGPHVRLKDLVVVAANETCVEQAKDISSGIERRSNESVSVAALVHGGDALFEARQLYSTPRTFKLSLVGDVKNRDVLVVDDMIDTAEKLMESVRVLKLAGAKRVVWYATHCLLTPEAIKIIQSCDGLDEVVVTNTIPLGNKLDNASCSKISQISIAPLLAEAVLRVKEGKSLQDLRVYDKDNLHERYAGQGKD